MSASLRGQCRSAGHYRSQHYRTRTGPQLHHLATKAHGQNKHRCNFTQAENFRAVYLFLNVLSLMIVGKAVFSIGRFSAY